MANFTAGTSFTDGVTNDVTAAKLNALIADAVPTSNLSLNSTTGTIATLNSTTGTIATLKSTTGTIVTGTFGTTTSTAATITTGTIPTLVATTLVTTGTGTAAAPAIVPTGDTNTGIFFPAADTIAFSEGGTEAMRIDSNGNVGIGTSTSLVRLTVDSGSAAQYGRFNSTAANGGYLTIESSGTVHGDIGTAAQLVSGGSATDFGINARGSRNLILGTNNTERLRIDSSGNVEVKTAGAKIKLARVSDASLVGEIGSQSGTGISIKNIGGTTSEAVIGGDWVAVNTNATERLRIDSSGRVGIGTTSPLKELQINATEPTIRLEESSAGSKRLELSVNNAAEAKIFANQSSGTLILGTVGTERIRITSGGEVYIAGTTDQGAYNLQVNGTGVWGAGAYVNGSDSRIKEDIQPIASGLDVVEKLNPVTYKYKETWSSDQSIQSGFIAQELLTALDGQIYANGVVQQGGAEGYYSVAYQNLIAVLTKAIQELKTENDSLKARVAALEAA